MAKRIRQVITKRYQRIEPRHDFLKHYKVVRMWAMKRYDIVQQDLELCLTLYSEGLFTYGDFKKMTITYSWDKQRFQKFIDAGYIHMFAPKKGNYAARYEVTRATRKMCASIYRKLNGDEPISESPQHNPIFMPGNYCYANKKLMEAIRNFNASIKS